MATLKSRLPQLAKQMRARASQIVRETALSIEADIKQDMAEGKSGRTYKRGRKTHTASAPGESPAIDNSDYVNSIQAVPVGEDEWAVGTNHERGPVLEYGGAHVAPRPHIDPAFERAQGEFQERMKEILK
jgi:hypothetical protein